jgi:hypothetical protein
LGNQKQAREDSRYHEEHDNPARPRNPVCCQWREVSPAGERADHQRSPDVRMNTFATTV